MKPLGLFLASWDSNGSPTAGMNDDYEWHLRQADVDRRVASATPGIRRESQVRRLLGAARRSLARPSLARIADQTIHRA